MSEQEEKPESGTPAEPEAAEAVEAVEAAEVVEATEADGPPAPDTAPANDDPASSGPPATAADRPAVPSKPVRSKPRHPALLRAFRAGRTVDGEVVSVVKGGYEVRLGRTRARAFCPHSHIDLKREDDPQRQVGQKYPFKIMQLRRGGEDIVLSRRTVLEEQRVEEAKSHTQRPEPLLAWAGAFLLAEIALARVFRRRLP